MFNGPLFLVGRPRSGTKLLRGLLNCHPEVSIPFWESNFIPGRIAEAQAFGDLQDREQFSLFFDRFRRIEFFREIARCPKCSDLVDEQRWRAALEGGTYADAIAAFFRDYAAREGARIWGDKSPHYMMKIPVLSRIFPEARFVHIIRDVRDHCISNRRAWGKSLLRSAQMWSEAIRKCRTDAARFLGPKAYLEITYEALLANPEDRLRIVCRFLEICFDPGMTRLSASTENLGDARNAHGILRSNAGKWRERNRMDSKTVRRIEEIAFEELRDLGYPLTMARRRRSLGRMELGLARLADAWNRLRFDCEEQGSVGEGLRYQYRKRRFG